MTNPPGWVTVGAVPHRLRELLAASPARTDALLAAALAIPSLVQVLVTPIAPRGVGVLVAVWSTAPIAWRRARPLPAALAGSLVYVVPTGGYVYLGYVAAFVLFYSLAAYEDDAARVALGTACGLLLTVAATAEHAEALGELFGGLTSVAAPAAVGRVVRRQRRQSDRLRELTEHLELERERGARAAVTEERARIARELHDVVAHGVSVIAIQSDAAEAAIDHDPALAREPLRTIRGSAGEALGEMRRLLGVLREEGEDGELTPQPGLAQVPALVESLRAAGVAVELELRGAPRTVAASIDLSGYRIVQEALTNVRKHAPGAAAEVCLQWGDEALELSVRNGPSGVAPRAGDSGGHGLVGMRERVRLHGGELRAGPSPDGGFEVLAVLPYREAR
jgi:signal transduction histidine kinase